MVWLEEGAGYASALPIARLFLLETLLLRAAQTRTPGSAPQTGHSGARARRNQGGPGQREPTR